MGLSSLDSYRDRYLGRPYSAVIDDQLREQRQRDRLVELKGMISASLPQARPAGEALIDRWNRFAYQREFWERDSLELAAEIMDDARSVAEAAEAAPTDDFLFSQFKIVTLNLAASAGRQRKMREFIGIKGRDRPYGSAAALSYPVAAMIYAAQQGVPGMEVSSFGVSNLGYLLLAAGVLGRSFRVFGLESRAAVFGTGVVVLLIGTVLGML